MTYGNLIFDYVLILFLAVQKQYQRECVKNCKTLQVENNKFPQHTTLSGQ